MQANETGDLHAPIEHEPLVSRYSGAEWLRRNMDLDPKSKPMSPLGIMVADLLGHLFYGLYHWDNHRSTDWSNSQYIRCIVHKELSTFDFSDLTRLVLLAHRTGLRVQVGPCNFRYMELIFHDRREPKTWSGGQRHPTIHEAIARLDAELAPVKEPVP